MGSASPRPAAGEPESTYAWLRLAATLAISTVGTIGMWSVSVALPAIEADFGIPRSYASLPYAATMVGFGLGGILTGRLADRHGILLPVLGGTLVLGAGFMLSGLSASLWLFALSQGVLVGIGSSALFAPLVADTSFWFTRRRGIAVAIAASGNYLAGAIWPPILQHFIATEGWRATYFGVGIGCILAIVPLTLALRRPRPELEFGAAAARAARWSELPLGFTPRTLQAILIVAGLSCCVAMSMPQVHIVAYCGDLGYGPARGAEMLSLMLACGVVSRLASGWISDRIGGLRTLLLGSVLQGVALALFLPFDGLVSLYVISALFGLFQGGIVPAYAIIVREYFPPAEAGARVGAVLMSTLVGMALGGWLTGVVFDVTGNYHAAFLHGIAWNVLNVAIATWLLVRARRLPPLAAAA